MTTVVVDPVVEPAAVTVVLVDAVSLKPPETQLTPEAMETELFKVVREAEGIKGSGLTAIVVERAKLCGAIIRLSVCDKWCPIDGARRFIPFNCPLILEWLTVAEVIPLLLLHALVTLVGAPGNPVPRPEPKRLEFDASLDRLLLPPSEIGS